MNYWLSSCAVTLGLLVVASVAEGAGSTHHIAHRSAADCAGFVNEIDDEQKNLSYMEAKLSIEDSAIRANLIAEQENSEMQTIQVNLATLRDSGCPAYPRPVSKVTYLVNALLCIEAEQKAEFASLAGNSVPDMGACSRNTWKLTAPN